MATDLFKIQMRAATLHRSDTVATNIAPFYAAIANFVLTCSSSLHLLTELLVLQRSRCWTPNLASPYWYLKRSC